MADDLAEQIVDALVNQYVAEGNAMMGAMKLNEFAVEDIDLLISPEEVPSSTMAAGSKTFLAGSIFGAKMAIGMITDNESEIDSSQIVQDNSDKINSSLSNAVADLTLQAIEQKKNEVDNW